MSQARKGLPTLQQIRREHNITARVIAEEAGVDFRTEYLLEIGAAVERDDALKILHAFSILTGKPCTEDTVGGLCIVTVPVIKDRKERSRRDTTGDATGL